MKRKVVSGMTNYTARNVAAMIELVVD